MKPGEELRWLRACLGETSIELEVLVKVMPNKGQGSSFKISGSAYCHQSFFFKSISKMGLPQKGHLASRVRGSTCGGSGYWASLMWADNTDLGAAKDFSVAVYF